MPWAGTATVAVIYAADNHGCEGVKVLIAWLPGAFPGFELIWADSAYCRESLSSGYECCSIQPPYDMEDASWFVPEPAVVKY